jgi:DNA-binding NarL/FixJ family response regulator
MRFEAENLPMSEKMIRTLVADDCEQLSAKMRELLETMPGMEVVGVASNGEEAVRLSEKLRPDLVIMDLQMPVMNGIEAARALAICLPKTRVVLTSAYGPEGTIRFPGLSAMEFVPKAQLWRALPVLVEKYFGKEIGN